MLPNPARLWRQLDLLRQFLAIATGVFLLGMGVVGNMLSQRIEKDVLHNTAVSTSLYFESFVTPHVQGLASATSLTSVEQSALQSLIDITAVTKRVLSFKIWRQDGIVAFASRNDLIGQKFEPTTNLKAAWGGQIAASLDDLEDNEDHHERWHGVPVLEVYLPIREVQSERIIAVAEFYESAEQLTADIARAKLDSWLLIAVFAAAALAALYGTVLRGSRTIDVQKQALQRRVEQLSLLLEQNRRLAEQVQRSSQRAAEINESYMRRFGAELHDGPAQLVGLALLRLDAVERPAAAAPPTLTATQPAASENVVAIRKALNDALSEIRNLSAGLSLPELEPLSIEETVLAAVRHHRRRTGTEVTAEISLEGTVGAHPLKAAVFRLVQEGLNNATRHADAAGQRVVARHADGMLTVEVGDAGPGFEPKANSRDHQLGLAGLQERMRALRGSLDIESGPSGTRLLARIPLAQG